MDNETFDPLSEEGRIDNDTYFYNADCSISLDGINEHFQSSSYSDSAIFGILIDVWTFLINCVVIYACLADKRTRKEPFYAQIINFSFCNILTSIFVIPLTVYYLLKSWTLGKDLCTLYVIMDLTLPFCSFLIIIILNIDRILAAQVPSVYSGIFRKSLPQLILFIPWISAIVIIVPLWTSGMIPEYEYIPCECHIAVSTVVAIACPLLSYFIPLVILIMLTLKLCMIGLAVGDRQSLSTSDRITLRHAHSNCEHSTDSNDNPTSAFVSSRDTDYRQDDNEPAKGSLSAVCSITFVMCVMWFPFQCISILLPLCSSESCWPTIGLNQFVTWTGAASAGVAPVFWFLDIRLKSNLKSLLMRPAYNGHNEERSRASVEVTYL